MHSFLRDHSRRCLCYANNSSLSFANSVNPFKTVICTYFVERTLAPFNSKVSFLKFLKNFHWQLPHFGNEYRSPLGVNEMIISEEIWQHATKAVQIKFPVSFPLCASKVKQNRCHLQITPPKRKVNIVF